jgi:hypothetical protein
MNDALGIYYKEILPKWKLRNVVLAEVTQDLKGTGARLE